MVDLSSSFAYAAAYLVKVDGPGPDRPDFSASGSTWYFGYITSGGSTSTYCGMYGYCSGGTWETGLDNLTVKLSPATAAPTGPVVCTIKPQNLFLAAHRPIHHLNDPRHPVHVLTVAATASGTPIKGAAVTLRASRGVFTASPSQPPSLNSLTSATDSNGRAAFGIDPPEATGFDRTDIVANVTSAGQTASCSAAVVVGLGTSEDFPVTHGAPGTVAHGQTDAMVAKIVEGTPLPLVASFSAASLQPVVARGSIVAAYGASLAASAETAAVVPLPVTLGGISVKVKDSSGVETSAPLFYAAPSQINYLVPQGAAAGLAAVTVLNGDQTVAAGTVRVDDVAPGLFAANGSGQGVAAAVGLRVADDQTQTRLDVYQCGAAAGSCTAVPRDLGAGTDSVFLLLFGTGIQNRSSLSAISATMGGVDVPVLFAGPQGDSAGLHRVNVRPIPATLRGRGEIAVLPTVDGKKANAITISIK